MEKEDEGVKINPPNEEEMIMRMVVVMGLIVAAMHAPFLMKMLTRKMVNSEGMELKSLVRNGERSGSREAEERWCCRERVFEWVAFKHCLNKCSRAFTKSGYSSEAR